MKVEEFDRHSSMAREFIDLEANLGILPESVTQETSGLLEACLADANPFYKRGMVRLFWAEADDAHARIAAIWDPEFAEANRGAAIVGFFASDDRVAVSRAVFDRACDWLRAQGARRVVGPINFSVYVGFGLMTGGFDTEPFRGEPRSPEYYPRVLEALGFTQFARYRSWDLELKHLEMLRDVSLSRAETDVLDRFDSINLDGDLAGFHRLMVEALAENVAEAPMPYEEFRYINDARSFFEPELTPVFRDESTVQAAGYLRKDSAERLILHFMMVHREHRRRGLAAAGLGWVLRQALEMGVTSGVGALAPEGLTVYDRIGSPTRTYGLYNIVL
jgi:GNAT superfamily N-acetyltransferase